MTSEMERLKMHSSLRALLCLLAIASLSARMEGQMPVPAPPQQRSVLVTGGTVHVGDGRTIDDGAVGFRDGRIDYVGYSYGVRSAYDTTISVTGEHIYPGIIAVDALLGLSEIGSIRGTQDVRDVGDMEPELRTLSAYKADSRVIPTVRANGVLMAQIVPRGPVISGTSSVVQLDAWDWEEAAYKVDDAVHLTWPAAFTEKGWWAEPKDAERNERNERQERIEALRKFFREAHAYAAVAAPEKVDVRLEAMRGLFNGSKRLFVRADRVKEITEAVRFARDEGVRHTVIVGGYDAWRVGDMLRENNVGVVLRRLHSLPLRADDGVHLPYQLPALLKERGVRFCLGYAGDQEVTGLRNLPFVAGTASAFGLSAEEALSAITRDAAYILGIADRCGTLAVGKDATLFVSHGDALDMRTNDVRHAFIQGRRIVLDDHQRQLYRMYRERIEGQ